MTKLQKAAWEIFVSSVKGAKGNSTFAEVVKQYGFTGPFAGLDNHYKDEYELINDLESAKYDFIDIPTGFRRLEEGDVMELTDMSYNYKGNWEFLGCNGDIGERWNEKDYRPMIRKI